MRERVGERQGSTDWGCGNDVLARGCKVFDSERERVKKSKKKTSEKKLCTKNTTRRLKGEERECLCTTKTR